MSWNPALTPGCPDEIGVDAIETLIIPRARDLGGFEVKRALPAPKRQMVGPFTVLAQAGPAEFLTGQGICVHPHPGWAPSPIFTAAISTTATASAAIR